jgi:23S rRNA (adenine2503-C2)-methyltransferase
MDKNLKDKTFAELEELVLLLGGKKYHAKYIFSFIHAKNISHIDELTTLSKQLRADLTEQGYYISRLKTIEKFDDPDGTVKYLFELEDGVRVETVLMINDGPRQRKTLCISCQAGCRMGCAFCATAKLKYERNLTAAEIVDQVNQVVADSGTVNNVVYMGMGEPLDNYENVIRSLEIINHHAGKNIGQRHLTVSTCGLPDAIKKFGREHLQVHLAVSLHCSNDHQRSKLMSVAKKHSLDEIMKAIHYYQKMTNRRVMFQYCMIEGVNDSDAEARQIVKLLKGLIANVNLIEYNPHPGCELVASSRDRIAGFMDVLMNSGVETTVRYRRGRSIKAACGQLGAAWLKSGSSDKKNTD